MTRQQLERLANNPNVRKFLDLLSYTEGTQGNGYHTAFGGGRLASLADHPRYLKSFKQTNGKTNKTSAAGRYQFLRGTWDNLARQYNFKDFGAKNQDLGAIALLAQNGSLPHILNGNWGQAVAKAGGTWASLPSSPHPQPTKSWRKVNDFLGGKIANPPPTRQVQNQDWQNRPQSVQTQQNSWQPGFFEKFGVANPFEVTAQQSDPQPQMSNDWQTGFFEKFGVANPFEVTAQQSDPQPQMSNDWQTGFFEKFGVANPFL